HGLVIGSSAQTTPAPEIAILTGTVHDRPGKPVPMDRQHSHGNRKPPNTSAKYRATHRSCGLGRRGGRYCPRPPGAVDYMIVAANSIVSTATAVSTRGGVKAQHIPALERRACDASRVRPFRSCYDSLETRRYEPEREDMHAANLYGLPTRAASSD